MLILIASVIAFFIGRWSGRKTPKPKPFMYTDSPEMQLSVWQTEPSYWTEELNCIATLNEIEQCWRDEKVGWVKDWESERLAIQLGVLKVIAWDKKIRVTYYRERDYELRRSIWLQSQPVLSDSDQALLEFDSKLTDKKETIFD